MKTNVLRKGATIFARDIPFGGNNYTQAIAQRLNISFEQAEAAKLGKDVGVKWETLVPPLEAVSRDLSLEVQRTFDYSPPPPSPSGSARSCWPAAARSFPG